ncbi:hypothetical protein [Sneathiella limimaris]|uniref:hypothetical protein n=1 Tax=Sneathiella limimaris TaxID=1964213 RepID=UPI00146F87BA|nr:hypothetical protein [Sneathiella limimaris]
MSITEHKKKKHEIFILEEAIRLLDVDWVFSPCVPPGPDFLIESGSSEFGLELTEVFKGYISGSGSEDKRRERTNQQIINRLKAEYHESSNVKLTVKLLGDIRSKNIEKLPRVLLDMKLEQYQKGQYFEFKLGPTLKVFVTVAYMDDWYLLNDRGGFVRMSPKPIIQDAINKKALKLKQYQRALGEDVRLLIYANRRNSSGKLDLKKACGFDLRGFREVYFFAYPDNIFNLS